jgi:hypothetical protein
MFGYLGFVNVLKVTGFHLVRIKGWIFIPNITNDDTRGSHGEKPGPKNLGQFFIFGFDICPTPKYSPPRMKLVS